MIDKTENNKIIYGFDVLKFLMALMIVAVHARAFVEPQLYMIMAPLMNVSVPLFFILSSFFLFRKILEEDKGEYVGRFLKRTSILYGFWFIVNLPLYWYENRPISNLIGGGKIIMDIFLRNTFHGSWFLSALFFGTLFVYVAHKVARGWGVLTILICAYTILYLPNLYIYSLDKFRSWFVSNDVLLTLSFFRGCYWIGIGYFLAHKSFINYIERYNATLFLTSAICLYIMIMLGINNLYLIFANAIYSFMYRLKLEKSTTFLRLRNLSILFYLLHFNVCGFFHRAFPDSKWLYSGVLFYCIVLLVVYILASCILYFEKHIKWLKYSH